MSRWELNQSNVLVLDDEPKEPHINRKWTLRSTGNPLWNQRPLFSQETEQEEEEDPVPLRTDGGRCGLLPLCQRTVMAAPCVRLERLMKMSWEKKLNTRTQVSPTTEPPRRWARDTASGLPVARGSKVLFPSARDTEQSETKDENQTLNLNSFINKFVWILQLWSQRDRESSVHDGSSPSACDVCEDLDILSFTGSQCREAQSSNMMSPSSCQHLGPTGVFSQTYWDVLLTMNHTDPVQREHMDEFLLLRQDVPHVHHHTVQVEDSCPTDLCYMWVTCPGPNSRFLTVELGAKLTPRGPSGLWDVQGQLQWAQSGFIFHVIFMLHTDHIRVTYTHYNHSVV